MSTGILSWKIAETPWAVIDFETTGLRAGNDRVVEVAIVRMDPGQPPRLVLDSLVNPQRDMAATEIHGISAADVADAPTFRELAGDVASAISGCLVSAYNAYFDVPFLHAELRDAGVRHQLPHVCLMWLRPGLSMGTKCRLADACTAHGVTLENAHAAAADALAAAELARKYQVELTRRGLQTFDDLSQLCTYKFIESLASYPLPAASCPITRSSRIKSRYSKTAARSHDAPVAVTPIAEYWSALCSALSDLVVTEDEIGALTQIRERRGISKNQMRALHAKAYGDVIAQLVIDKELDDLEAEKISRLGDCLRRVGYAPGD